MLHWKASKVNRERAPRAPARAHARPPLYTLFKESEEVEAPLDLPPLYTFLKESEQTRKYVPPGTVKLPSKASLSFALGHERRVVTRTVQSTRDP